MMFGRADIQGIKKVLQYVDIVGLVLFLTLFALGVPAERQVLEPILSRNIIKLQITDNQILSKV